MVIDVSKHLSVFLFRINQSKKSNSLCCKWILTGIMNLHLHLYGKLKTRRGRTIGNSVIRDRASVGRMTRHRDLEWGGGELLKV